MDTEARALEEQVGSPQRVVSLAFESRFGLSLSALAAEREKTVATLSLADCAGNRDARFSFKFHCPSGKFAEARIRSLTSKRLRDFVREPIVLGSSVSPSDYEEGTGKLYASMATLKTGPSIPPRPTKSRRPTPPPTRPRLSPKATSSWPVRARGPSANWP